MEGLVALLYGQALDVPAEDALHYYHFSVALEVQSLAEKLSSSFPSEIETNKVAPSEYGIIIENSSNHLLKSDEESTKYDFMKSHGNSSSFKFCVGEKSKFALLSKVPCFDSNQCKETSENTSHSNIDTSHSCCDEVPAKFLPSLIHRENYGENYSEKYGEYLTPAVDCLIELSASDTKALDVTAVTTDPGPVLTSHKICKRKKTRHKDSEKCLKNQFAVGGALKCLFCNKSFRKCTNLVKHVISLKHFTDNCPICSFQVG